MNNSSSQQDNYSFKLNDFDTNSSSLLRGIRYETDFKDVSLACEGGKVSAHKVILSGCSSMFKSILQKNPHPHPFIYFKGVNLCDLRALLDFIYKGECRVPCDRLIAFLSLAEELNVNGFSEEAIAKHSAETREPPPQENNNMNLDEVCTLKDKNDEEKDDSVDTIPIPDEDMLLANISEEMGPGGSMVLKCDLCSKIVKTKHKDNLLSHLESKHFPGMFSYECQQCGKKYNCRKSLTNHSSFCPNRVINDEETCDDTIPDEVMLLANISEEMVPGGKIFKCDLCSKMIKWKHNMLSHIESKHFPGMFSYECQQCGKKYDNRKSLGNHFSFCRNRQTKRDA